MLDLQVLEDLKGRGRIEIQRSLHRAIRNVGRWRRRPSGRQCRQAVVGSHESALDVGRRERLVEQDRVAGLGLAEDLCREKRPVDR